MQNVAAAVPVVPPKWAAALRGVPAQRLPLGHFPTPLVRWHPTAKESERGREFWLKRDDLSGMELSGNKVRKLEFLLADAVQKKSDCIVTVGGLQSNHCRATAVAAAMLGLECHLVLRVEDASVRDADAACKQLGLSGNLLLDRLFGANVALVTKEEFRNHGAEALMDRVATRLRKEGRRPYVIPAGGSNALGTWGYLTAFQELLEQAAEGGGGGGFFSDIVLSVGSGGSLAGIALANHLSKAGARVWAFSSGSSPSYLHKYIDDEIFANLLPREDLATVRCQDLAEVQDAKGLGYARSTLEELRFLRDVAMRTGVLLDPTYSGKALFKFLHLLEQPRQSTPEECSHGEGSPSFGRRVLFWHTGGLFGMWDKQKQLCELLDAEAQQTTKLGAVLPLLPSRSML